MPMALMDLLGLWIESRSGLFMDNDRLLIILTFGVKGSCMTTIDIEGEVWKCPCHNLLALSPWLEL
jgi:hypothetical protein